MALKLKYKDEHGILHINMSPTSTPTIQPDTESEKTFEKDVGKSEFDPKFDTINHRFGQCDLFGGKYDCEDSGGETRSLFRSRYNSIEEELANTPYAFTDRSLHFKTHSPLLDITIDRGADISPSKDIEDDRFFNRHIDLFGPSIDKSIKSSDEDNETPAFTVTQLIHAQDRYFDLSSRQSSQVSKSEVISEIRTEDKGPISVKIVQGVNNEAFKVLSAETAVKAVQADPAPAPASLPVVPTAKRKREKSFAIIAEPPSRPSSPRSLPVDVRTGRISPFRGRGFREETSRHSTPKTSAANSRASSPPRRRTSSLSRIDSMAAATLPPPLPPIQLSAPHTPHTPRDFVKENIEEIRELSELNREKHEAEAEKKRQEEEEALLKEMGLLDQNAKSDAIRSVVCSRTTSRSNSPSKVKLRSRSNSPAAKVVTSILRHEPVQPERFINQDDGMGPTPVTHRSRIRSVSKSQPQSNDGSPKHSKIPKRQNSVSPNRKRDASNSRKPAQNGLKNQRFISNSTSSIHETIRIGSQAHDRRNMSKSTQFLNISPAHLRGKPPISPGKGGPPPSNRAINAKRLSPIVGTPNKSPTEDPKPKSARTPSKPTPMARKPVKTAGNTPATSRLNSRQPSRNVSRDPSPDKRRTLKSSTAKPPTNTTASKSRPVARAVSTRTTQKPVVNKPEPKKPINRTSSMKSLSRTPSTKTLNEKPPLKKRDSKVSIKSQSTSKLNELDSKTNGKDESKSPIKADKGKDVFDKVVEKVEKEEAQDGKKSTQSSTDESSVTTQDNETQYDRITNEKGELVIMTKKNIISMTTAAITSQPLEVVTKVTNQLPITLEKAKERAIFERNSSKDSLAPKDEDQPKTETTEDKHDAKTRSKTGTIFTEDNVKLKPLLPPYNNPQVEKVKLRIEEILKSPEVSAENIAAAAPKAKEKEKENKDKSSFKNIADKTKSDLKDAKDETAKKFTEIKNQAAEKVAAEKSAVEKAVEDKTDKIATEIRSEASKIVDSIMTPIEEPKIEDKPKETIKKDIEPTVVVVNQKTNGPSKADIVEKMTETLVKGEAEVEVQSSNMSTPGLDKMALQNKMADGNGSDKSTHSNGGFPQSTSTTPKPPARTKKEAKDDSKLLDSKELTPDPKKQSIGQRLLGKCKKCCACCGKHDEEKEMEDKTQMEEKRGMMSRLNCCRKAEKEERDAEMAAGKAASIEFETETKRKRKLRDIMCGCCGNRRRVSDVSHEARYGDVGAHDVTAPSVVGETGCCGRKKSVERRDSILSDRPPNTCCNNRLFTWLRGCCRRQQSDQLSASRRQSLFSKNKSLSPTLPPEDTRKKLDPSLIEHTSMIRGAIPVLPIALAWFCLCCNIIVPGLGTIFSGIFCLCFGIPRFGVHDGAKYRIGAFVIDLLVGCGQLFTVLFCLVGWGWSIWWGVIMVRMSRKYRKLKAEAAAEEAEAPPVTANNHTRA